MGRNSPHAWSIIKSGPEPLLHRDKLEYRHHKRACRVYSQWMVGFSEEEIARFFEIVVQDVQADVQHIQQVLPARTVIAHLNDRNRIIIQRAEGEKYQRLLSEALSTSVSTYLKAGVSPAGAMKEYREAVGMVEKAGTPSVSVTQTVGITDGKITSAEDLIRLVTSKMSQAEGLTESVPVEKRPSLVPGSPDRK